MPPVRLHPVYRDRLAIIVAYVLAWGLLLVNRGLYWDDWTLYGQSPSTLVQTYLEVGLPWFGVFHAAIFSLPLPGLASHWIAFTAYLASSLLVYSIVARTPGLTRMDALVTALVFAVLPVNYARIAVIDLPYGLCLLAFLAATYLLLRHLEAGGAWRRASALVLFVCSFFTASMLVMYAIPIALAAYVTWRSGRSLRTVAIRHLDFIALPAVYFGIKAVLFVPHGVYEGYNALTVRGLLHVPAAMLRVPMEVLIEPLARAVRVGGLLGLAVGAAVAVWLVWRTRAGDTPPIGAQPSGAGPDGSGGERPDVSPAETGPIAAPVLAAVGAIAIALGVFAYLAVGLVPSIWDWTSRHQLLVPIGAGLLAAAVVRGVRGVSWARPPLVAAVGLMIGIAVVADARTLLAYQADWFKQAALVQQIGSIAAVRTASHIRVVDDAAGLNAMRRKPRFYEYNALFSLALGDERRLVASAGSEPSPADVSQFVARPQYHMRAYVPQPVDLQVRITRHGGRPGPVDVLRLVALEAVGSAAFRDELSRLIDVTASPLARSGVTP